MERKVRFDKASVNAIAEELGRAVKEIAKKHGIQARLKGGRFDGESFSPRVEFFIPAIVEENLARNAQTYASLYDLPPDIVGKTYRENSGKEFRVVGIDINKRKNKVILEEVIGGGKYHASIDYIQRYFPREEVK